MEEVYENAKREDASPELYGAWPMVLSGLETWLDIPQTLTAPGLLRYA